MTTITEEICNELERQESNDLGEIHKYAIWILVRRRVYDYFYARAHWVAGLLPVTGKILESINDNIET